MENAVIRPFFEEPSRNVTIAPVIPIKSVRTEGKKEKIGHASSVMKDRTIPTFTQPVFKPKRHDMF